MKDGYIVKGYKISKNDLEKIKKFSKADVDESKIYTFSLILCDNDIDRDFERFSVNALNELAKLFVGKTGIFDHSMKSENQKARVFDTWVEKDSTRKTADNEDYYCLKAKAYMARTEENKSLIAEIEMGIKKEVSVSCSMASAVCSVCHGDKRKGECQHINGKKYGEKLAFSVLDNAVDAYEWSFVAVPAQRNAGVIKSYKKGGFFMKDIIKNFQNASKDVVLSKEDAKSVFDYVMTLENEANLGKEYKKNLVSEVTKLCAISLPEMDKDTFSGVAEIMTAKELLSFKNAFSEIASRKMPYETQLKRKQTENKNNNSEFRI